MLMAILFACVLFLSAIFRNGRYPRPPSNGRYGKRFHENSLCSRQITDDNWSDGSLEPEDNDIDDDFATEDGELGSSPKRQKIS